MFSVAPVPALKCGAIHFEAQVSFSATQSPAWADIDEQDPQQHPSIQESDPPSKTQVAQYH